MNYFFLGGRGLIVGFDSPLCAGFPASVFRTGALLVDLLVALLSDISDILSPSAQEYYITQDNKREQERYMNIAFFYYSKTGPSVRWPDSFYRPPSN